MNTIPHCPNPRCPSNQEDFDEKLSFRKKGFETNKKDGKIQRYQCKCCWITFNINIFTIGFYTKKRISYKKLIHALISASGIRDMARQLRCSPNTIQNRINRLAHKAMGLWAPLMNSMELQEDLTADGLESFILSQYFPTNINILVGHQSQFLYFFNAYHFHRKGRKTEEQKERAKELYALARFEDRAPSNNFRELLDQVGQLLDRSSMNNLILDTDENPIYHHQYQKHPVKERVKHRKTNSKEKRDFQNKLFPCNYIDRQVRKDQAEHVRETVQFGRNMNNSMNRFAIYSFWHNFRKPYRINKGKLLFQSHGHAAGIEQEIIGNMWEQLLDESRFFFFKVKEKLNPFMVRLWKKQLVNPLNVPSLGV